MARPRKAPASPPEIPLGATWPGFLDLLDSDPELAFELFYAFTVKLLKIGPPRVFLSVDQSRRQDLLHDVILHCCREDFRVLRQYTDRGRPFAAWLQLVTRNKVLDFLRADRHSAALPLDGDEEDGPEIPVPDTAPGADLQIDRHRTLELVRAALAKLSDACRILIQGAAEGYKPRELTRLMGWPADWNKKASDDLRECRKRLRKLLADMGLSPEELQNQFSG